MNIQQQLPCRVQFLDCLGYYDLGAQILQIIGIIFVMIKCISNYKQLKLQRTNQQQSQYQKSIIRKIIVNQINIVYLTTFLISSLFSIALFIVYLKGGKQDITKIGLNDWYKFSQILFINQLNCLNLTVGFLYWKASRAYYKLQNQDIPSFLGNKIKLFFYFIYILNFLTILGFFIYILLTTGGQVYDDLQVMWLNVANLLGIILSSLMCLSTRMYYDCKILQSLKLSVSARRIEYLFSFGILVATIIRIIKSILDITIDNEDQFLRDFNNTTDCLDISPSHGIYILILIVFVDLMPSYLFCKIFSTIKQKKKMNIKSDPQSDLQKKMISDEHSDSLDYM